MAIDLHPDVVRAINEFANTKLGRRYGKWAQKNYGIGGKRLLAKTNAGEAGGKPNRQAGVSSAGARGSMQFIPSTRAAYKSKYGVDAWGSDLDATKAAALHHLSTGVAGYNPGMSTYTSYIMGQDVNEADMKALRTGRNGRGGGAGGGTRVRPGSPARTKVSRDTYTIPGQSFEAERSEARRGLLMGGDINMKSLLDYKSKVNELKDVPSRKVTGDLKVKHTPGTPTRYKTGRKGRGGGGKSAAGVPQGYKGKKGGIYEVFFDPAGEYYDSGGIQKGAIGGHGTHVHVSADRGYVVKIGRYAKSLGLTVGGQKRFGGTPTSGHAKDSFHYRDMGIDVTGDPDTMARFAKTMRREAQRGHGR